MPKTIAAGVGSRRSDRMAATANATSPMMASTDRSTFLVMTTIASPTAAMAMIAASTETSVRLAAERACGARIATSAPIRRSTTAGSARARAAAPSSRLSGLVCDWAMAAAQTSVDPEAPLRVGSSSSSGPPPTGLAVSGRSPRT